MESLADLLKPQYLWIVVGFAFLIMETAMPGLITGFFGLGAILVGVLCWFVDLSLNAQLLIFVVSSVVFLVTLRKSFLKLFGLATGKARDNEDIMDDFIGQRAVVLNEINPTKNGKVEFHGSTWAAAADEKIAKGTAVEIVDKANITLKVKSI